MYFAYFYNMNFFKQLFFVILASAVVMLSACESNNHLRSEKKIKSQIQGTWKLVYPIGSELWTFDDGTFYVSKNIAGAVLQDTGIYSVEATWKEPYVTIKDAELINTSVDLNGKWTIIELDNKVLYFTIRPSGSGLEQREFIKE